ETYRGFHYPNSKNNNDDVPSFLSGMFDGATSSFCRGEKVRIYGSRRAGIPTLYANVRIAMPPSAKIFFRNVVGPVDGANLSGDLTIDTGCGDVKVASFDGKLSIDTGSGDVSVKNGAAGRLVADTGSGSVEVLGVELEELVADTGSGDVSV